MQKLLSRSKQQVAFRRIFVSAIFCLAMVAMVNPQGAVRASGYLPAPTILGPEVSETEQPTIVGVTKNGTNVAVYIDNVFQGYAEVAEGEEGTASFAYTPYLSVKPGSHMVQVRAEKQDGSEWSVMTEEYEIMVKYPYPAPTVFEPVVNDTTTRTRPYMVGLVKSNSYVEIYIDNELVETTWIEDSENDVTDFAYSANYDLDPNADHYLYARAKAENGKTSYFSNVVGFKIQAAEKQTETSESTEVSKEDNSETIVEDVEESEASMEAENAEEVTEDVEEEMNQDDEVKEVSEEEVVEGQDEDMEGNQSVASEEDTDDEDTDTKDDESDEEEGEESNLVLWLVVIAVVIIIVVTRLTSKSEDDEDDGQGSLFDNNNEETKSTGVVDVKETDKNDSSGSSSY